VVRRIPDFDRPANPDQASLFELWRSTRSSTSDLDRVIAAKTHRGTRSSSRSTQT